MAILGWWFDKCAVVYKISLVVAVLIALFLLFFRLGERDLERWDEQTNADVVHSTTTNNSFPVLMLDDEPFFEKPPLWYYVTIALVELFGESNFVLRFLSALSGFILFVFLLYFSHKYFGRKVTLVAAVSFLTCQQLFVNRVSGIFATHNLRSADLDALQLLFMFVTVVVLFKFHEKRSSTFVFVIALTTGLGILTKGFFALLPIIVFALYVFIRKQEKIMSLRDIFTFAFVLFLSVAPWHIFMSLMYGTAFWSPYLGYHTVQRTVFALEGHSEDILFHVTNLANPSFFLTGFVFLAGIAYLLWHRKKYLGEFRYFFITMYSLVVLLIVTLVQTKLSWYVMYVYPIAAVVVGVVVNDVWQRGVASIRKSD